MVRVIFDGSKLSLNTLQQVGSGPIAFFEGLPLYQRGYGNLALRQRGAGIGSVLKSLWRYLKPLASSFKPLAMSAGRELGKEGLSTTARILNKASE